jgi:hypothetical protein
MSATLLGAFNSFGSCVPLGPPPLQVEYKMHAEEMMRRRGSDRVWELPSATP